MASVGKMEVLLEDAITESVKYFKVCCTTNNKYGIEIYRTDKINNWHELTIYSFLDNEQKKRYTKLIYCIRECDGDLFFLVKSNNQIVVAKSKLKEYIEHAESLTKIIKNCGRYIVDDDNEFVYGAKIPLEHNTSGNDMRNIFENTLWAATFVCFDY